MTQKATFQSITIKLQNFWADYGCLLWQPYYTQVGAGTMNPATFLRVLGPEPWHVAYVEPSVRPDDGRYGENPNRYQLHYQYQVILKPDPGNPQELYLDSLKAIGVDPRRHDIRFVEGNWEQPAISAWGLGWEVWMDGQEITQFTYFQQVGGQLLEPVSVEMTYGLERILIALNNAESIWDEQWASGVPYGEVRRQEEFEHSKYYFEVADVVRARQMYELYLAEAEVCLEQGMVLPAYDYVLKSSHAFNTLDARGAIGVAERQTCFHQMRELARRVAEGYLAQRQLLEYPLLGRQTSTAQTKSTKTGKPVVQAAAPFLLEIGVEEMPAGDMQTARAHLLERVPQFFSELYIESGPSHVYTTPRRLVIFVESLSPRQAEREELIKGPPAARAFDKDGNPTQALIGFAKGKGVDVGEVQIREMDGGEYAVVIKKQPGHPTSEVLIKALPGLLEGIKFDKAMRWNDSGVAFSRPIRWLVAMLGTTVVPFQYAGVTAGQVSRGLRPYGSPEIAIHSADGYADSIKETGILLDQEARRARIVEQVKKAAASVAGEAIIQEEILSEVTGLVERPTAVLGSFDAGYLTLPGSVLVSVMEKHQRYFPLHKGGKLLPNFITIRNGDGEHLEIVRQGNEHVLGARFADADFFVREDSKHELEEFRPKLAKLTFQAKLGSMLQKVERIERLVEKLAPNLGLDSDQAKAARRAAHLCKADLVTKMVVEMTSLQGVMGSEYALRSGESHEVARAIGEQYQMVPHSAAGLALALADRLDSLVGLFAAGLIPTGAKDPFALRRAALGIVQPLIERAVTFDLREAVLAAAESQPVNAGPEVQSQVLDFIAGRLGVLLKETCRYDVVEAVLAAQSNNPTGSARAVEQLQAWVEREDWNVILPAYARCVRITRDQKKTFAVKTEMFVEEAERILYDALQTESKSFNGDVEAFLNTVVKLIPAINAFFDQVLVMDEDRKLRENRLALVQRVASLAEGVADMSRLEGF